MKLSLSGVLFACLLSACSEDATVLTSEGDKIKGLCRSTAWIECVQAMCPTGYTIVKSPKDDANVMGIIKCNKP